MENLNVEELTGIDWAGLAAQAQTLGVEFGIQAIVAVLIFYIGRVIARIISKGVRNVMQKQEVDKILESFVSNLVYWLLMTFVIIAAINQLGIQTTSLIAIMGAAGLAVGLALQGSLSNFAAGVLIVLFRPYRVGDFVEAAGISGSVEQVQILTTILKTPDNKKIIDDLDKVRAILEEITSADERILKDPECVIKVHTLADSSVNFVCRPWVATSDYWAVYWDLTEKVKKRFDQEGVSIPFPQQDVYIHQVSS